MQHSWNCVIFATGMHKYHTHLVLHKCHTPLAHTHTHAYAQVRTRAHIRAPRHTRASAFRSPKQKTFLQNESGTNHPQPEQNKKQQKKNRYKSTTYKIVTKNTCNTNRNMQFWYQSKRLETKRKRCISFKMFQRLLNGSVKCPSKY